MDITHTYACAAVLTLNKDESGHNIGTHGRKGRGVGAGGADEASLTPGAMSRKGTNQEREVERPTLTVSASITEPNRASTGDELSQDGVGSPHNVAARGLQCLRRPWHALEAPSLRGPAAAWGVRC